MPVPSVDQSGTKLAPGRPAVSCLWSAPSGFITKISAAPVRVDTNASLEPSLDQAGIWLRPANVSCFSPRPSGRTVKICGTPETMRVNAMSPLPIPMGIPGIRLK